MKQPKQWCCTLMIQLGMQIMWHHRVLIGQGAALASNWLLNNPPLWLRCFFHFLMLRNGNNLAKLVIIPYSNYFIMLKSKNNDVAHWLCNYTCKIDTRQRTKTSVVVVTAREQTATANGGYCGLYSIRQETRTFSTSKISTPKQRYKRPIVLALLDATPSCSGYPDPSYDVTRFKWETVNKV